MNLTNKMTQYIQASQDDLHKLIRDLCAIPAPSHHEEKRAAFCKAWFEQIGATNVTIDDALNTVCPYGVTDDNDLVVFMAHTDTVFPDMEPMPFSEHDGMMFSPGITDDTASLAVLMICARYIIQNQLPTKTGILFVANSCEEGLGNLKGSRQIVETYGPRIKEFLTLDLTDLYHVVTKAIGSHRYRVTVRTEGGHSLNAFGNRNAIHCLASMINTLYSVKVPQDGDSTTTYNVGVVSGGTSVNTIAQHAEMLYEYRSDSLVCLNKMEEMLRKVADAYRSTGIEVEVELIGERPCSGDIDPERHQALIDRVSNSIQEVLALTPVPRSASTDANIPMAVGIPSVCIGVCIGGKCHTREEWLDVASLQDGCKLLMDVLGYYFA